MDPFIDEKIKIMPFVESPFTILKRFSMKDVSLLMSSTSIDGKRVPFKELFIQLDVYLKDPKLQLPLSDRPIIKLMKILEECVAGLVNSNDSNLDSFYICFTSILSQCKLKIKEEIEGRKKVIRVPIEVLKEKC